MPPERKIAAEEHRARPPWRGVEQPEPREQERDDHGREDLEEALDPEVHHPPAPVLGHRQVRVLPRRAPAP